MILLIGLMRNNKITIIFDEVDAKRFEKISQQTKWQDKFLITVALRHYYQYFSKNWKTALIKALEEAKNEPRVSTIKRH